MGFKIAKAAWNVETSLHESDTTQYQSINMWGKDHFV